MEKFAFIIHPLDVKDMAWKFPFSRYLPEKVVEKFFRLVPPMKVSHITGIETPYNRAEGWFVTCPLTSRQMVSLPEKYVTRRIIQAGRVAEKLGAKIVGLGAFTSVVGDAGHTIAKNLDIAVTTGNSFTVATALEGAREAARLMGHNLKNVHVAVLGATDSTGRVFSMMMAGEVKKMTLIARHKKPLEELAEKILYHTGLSVGFTSDIKAALKTAQIVIAISSSIDTMIGPEDLMPGAVICDISRPRNICKQVAIERDDILVLEGGMVKVPGDVNFNFKFAFTPGMAYACMAETMILALEGRYENFSLGRELTIEQVTEISALAKKHGFKLAGFLSFERAVASQEIEIIRRNALEKGLQVV